MEMITRTSPRRSRPDRSRRGRLTAAALAATCVGRYASGDQWLNSNSGLWYTGPGTDTSWSLGGPPESKDGFADFSSYTLSGHPITGPKQIYAYDQYIQAGPTVSTMRVGGTGYAWTFIPVPNPSTSGDVLGVTTLQTAGSDVSGSTTESQIELPINSSSSPFVVESVNYASGGTAQNIGAVAFNSGGGISVTGSGGFTVGGTTFDLYGPISYYGPTTITGDGTLNLHAGGSVPAGITFALPGGTTLGLYGSSYVPAKLTGTGQLVIGSGNSFSVGGATDLSGFYGTLAAEAYGVIVAGSDGALGPVGTSGSSLRLDGGTLQTTATFTLTHSVSVNGGNLTSGVGYPTINTSSGTLTATGYVTGSGLNKSGNGTLVLANGLNQFQGLFINQGTVQFSVAGDLGPSTSSSTIGLDGGTLELLGGNAVTLAESVNIGGSTGTIYVDAGSSLALTSVVSDSYNLGGDLHGPHGTLVANGGGTLVLSGANTYTGGTQVNGNLSISSDGNLGQAGAPVTFGTTAGFVNGHVTLVFGSLTTTTNFTSARPISAGTNGATFTPAYGTALTLTGAVTGSGSSAGLAVNGAGTVNLTGPNSFTGGTYVSSGTLGVGPLPYGSNADPLGTGVVTLAGGTLNLQGKISNAPTQQALAITSGFNQDVVIERTATNYQSAVTSGFDSTSNTSGYAFYENGYSANGSTGLPSSRTFTSGVASSINFSLQPYNGNNVLLMQSGMTGTLTLGSPGVFSRFDILAAASNGAGTLRAIYNYTDGTADAINVTVPDWFTASAGAINVNGRVDLSSGYVQTVAGYPRLYEIDVPVPTDEAGKAIASLSFQNVGTAPLGVFAVSGLGAPIGANENYPNGVTVTANSAINCAGGAFVNLGPLTIGNNTLSVVGATGGALTFPSSTITGNAVFNVASGFTVNLGAVTGGGGFTVTSGGNVSATSIAPVSSLNLATGKLSLNGIHAVVATGTLTINGPAGGYTALVDLQNNDLAVTSVTATTLATITSQIREGYDGGDWNGPGGITSSAAAADAKRLTAVGVYQNTGFYNSSHSFDGFYPSSPIQVLIKVTYYGDGNLDGKVDGSDYSMIDNAFLADRTAPGSMTGWQNGDYNYDGTTDGSDYTLIDNDFNRQLTATSFALVADPTALAALAAVPEPAGIAVLAAATIFLAGRRGGRSDR